MKNFFKIVVNTFFLSLFFSCGFSEQAPQDTTNYGQPKKTTLVFDFIATEAQVDSVCRADSLSNDFKRWINAYFIDFETRDTVFKHTFIRENNNEQIIYVVTEWREGMKITKRITK